MLANVSISLFLKQKSEKFVGKICDFPNIIIKLLINFYLFYKLKKGTKIHDFGSFLTHYKGFKSSSQRLAITTKTKISNKKIRHFSAMAESVPERIRTSDLPLRRRSLYPTELRKHTQN